MRLVKDNSYPTRAHGMIVKYSTIHALVCLLSFLAVKLFTNISLPQGTLVPSHVQGLYGIQNETLTVSKTQIQTFHLHPCAEGLRFEFSNVRFSGSLGVLRTAQDSIHADLDKSYRYTVT